MDEQPDVSRGTGVPGSSGGELRRDRRRLREAARAEAESADARGVDPATAGDGGADALRLSAHDAVVPGAEPSVPAATPPETGGFSAFEALGFDRAALDASGGASGGAQASPSAEVTPPQSSGVTPPVYGSPVVPVEVPSAGLPVTENPSPPPLLEPPRPEATIQTQGFSASTLQTSGILLPPTDAAGQPQQYAPSWTATPTVRPDTPAPPAPQEETSSEASYPPVPVDVSAPVESDPSPTTAMQAEWFAPASAEAFRPVGSLPGPGDVGGPAGHFGDAASPAPIPDAAPAPSHDAAAGGHPVLGSLSPRPREVPGELRVFDIASLVLAFVLPPVGFAVALFAVARGRALRGWPSPLARAARWIAVVMTLVMVGVGLYLGFEAAERREAQEASDAAAAAHAAVVAESAEFCAALAATPALFDAGDPDFGWPAVEDPAGYVPAISAYAATWQGLVPLAPAGVAEQVTSFSARVDGIVAQAGSLPAPNRAGDLLDLHSQPDITAIEGYVGEYCTPANTGE